MLLHGHYQSELLKSTVMYIPKYATASLLNSVNYQGTSMSNSIGKLLDDNS